MKDSTIELILGTAQLVNQYGITRNQELRRSTDDAHQLLRRAYELGIRIIDTAPAYGEAEFIIGNFSDAFEIHTKLRHAEDPIFSLSDSLQRLRRESLEVLYLHDVEQLYFDSRFINDEFKFLKKSGALEVGVSLYEPQELEKLESLSEVSVVQVPLNILDQRFFEFVKSRRYRTIVRSAFLQGLLLANPHNLRPEVQHLSSYLFDLENVLMEQGLTKMEAALSYVASSGASGVIVGCQDVHELEQIVDTWNRVINDSLHLRLPTEFQLPRSESVDPRNWGKHEG